MKNKLTPIRKIIYFISLLYLTLCTNLYGLEPHVRFEHINAAQGLSSSSVRDVFQDSKGFIWFATFSGLNRFDGQNMVVYRHNPFDEHSISSNKVNTLFEDSAGNLWIGTGGGLNKFDRKTEVFTSFKNNPNDPFSISNSQIWSIDEDQAGNLLVLTSNSINKFDTLQQTFTNITQDTILQNERFMTFLKDELHILWVGTRNGLYKFNTLALEIKVFRHDPADPTSLSNNWITKILKDSTGTIWLGTSGGGLNQLVTTQQGALYHRKGTAESFIHFRSAKAGQYSKSTSLSNDTIRDIIEDNAGNLWIATHNGLNRFNLKTGLFTVYQNKITDPSSLSARQVFSLLQDKTGVLWVGTHKGGVNKFQINTKFEHYLNDHNNVVLSFMEDNSGDLWVGTQGGLEKKELATGKSTLFIHDPSDATSISDDTIRSMFQDKSGIYWFGTDKGLNRFDQNTGRFTHFRHDANDPESITNDWILAIVEDRFGFLWLGTRLGLTRFNKTTGKSIQYIYKPSYFVSNLMFDSDNNLWGGVLGQGLYRYIIDENGIISYQRFRNSADASNLSSKRVFDIYEDAKGIIWVGTRDGLNRLVKDQSGQLSFISYRRSDGLVDEYIHGILADDNDNLWLSTNAGISRITFHNNARYKPIKAEFSVRHYDVSDGLQSNEFSNKLAFKAKNGRMYFGGINGFNGFFPEKIKDDLFIPPIVITDFKLANQSIKAGMVHKGRILLKQAISETKHINLSYLDTVFSFEFAALHYAYPKNNQYAYMMEGFEHQWNYSNNRRFVTYTNLSAGDYVFRVKGSNSDGVWNEKGASIKIHIPPPPWKKWWAYALYILSTVAILALFIHQRIAQQQAINRTLQVVNKTLEQQVKTRTQALESKTQALQDSIVELKVTQKHLVEAEKMSAVTTLLSGMAHKMNTPLGVGITGVSFIYEQISKFSQSMTKGKLTKSKLDALIDELSSGSKLALNAMNNLAKLVSQFKMIAVNVDVETPKKFGVIELLKNQANLVIKQLEHNKPTIDIRGDNISIVGYPLALVKVLDHLMSNSVEHAFAPPFELSQTPSITINIIKLEHSIEILYQDNGKGIELAQVGKIFEPFNTTTMGDKNVGIGLTIVYNLVVQLMQGKILYKQSPNEGLIFSIILPLEVKI